MDGSLHKKAFFVFLIIGIIFPLIKSTSLEEFDTQESYKFEIDLKGNNYAECTIQGTEDSINYVLSAYSDENRQNRVQLGQSYDKKTKLYISSKNVEKNKVYLEIECSSYPCSGEIDYEVRDKIVLIDGEPINYFINQDNEEIKFSMNLESDSSNIWVRGQKEIKSNLNYKSDSIISKTLSNAFDSYIVNEKRNNIELTVTAKKGDFINVGFMGYTKKDGYYSHEESLIIDGPVITGFLNKKFLNKVCYNLDESKIGFNIIMGNGILYTKFAAIERVLVEEEPKNDGELNIEYIRNYFIHPYTKVCITFPNTTKYPEYEEVENIIFTYQIEQFKDKTTIEKEPQINGILYPRRVRLNSTVGFISHKDNFEKMSLSLDTLRGFPKMYVYKCENYPLCSFDKETLNNAVRPRNINRFSSYNVLKEEEFDNSPISKKQTLFVVQCQEAEELDKENEELKEYMDILCDFYSLINKENTAIQLVDEQFFNQYALMNEEHNYKIKLGNEKGIEKVFIDIMTYIGDVEINTQKIKDSNINLAQYDSINKIFISVKTVGEPLEELEFSVKALNNTYYTILVTFGKNKKDEDSFITNTLQTGMSYLVTVDSTVESSNANKIIKFHNERLIDEVSYLVNFYSLNCEIDVNYQDDDGNEKPLDHFAHFSNDFIDRNDERYDITPYKYKITVKNEDPSQYVQNLCKIYASAIELSKNHTENSRDILIPDNTPQQIMLSENSKHISFGYVHVDFKNDLLIKFNLIHTAKYLVKIYYERYEREESITIVADNLIYLSSDEWNDICKDNSRACYIRVDITFEEKKKYDKPLLELSIKSIGSNFVDYIPKNRLKLDYVQTNYSQYYYSEIGVNENGFITINFLRGSGKIFARTVDKNLVEPEKDANWKGKYRLPKENDILNMDPYTKQMKFSTSDSECENGCYLLIKVVSDVISDRIELGRVRNYPFSIIINSYYNTLSFMKIPAISIPLDEFIIGSINPSSSNRLSQYYSVTLNDDADSVIIDWQSKGSGLYINVGNEKPLVEKYDFLRYSNDKDTIFRITKNEIISKNKAKDIKDTVLTLGVWTNHTDIYTTPFSFAIRLEKQTQIYRVNSDQKVLCEAKETNDNKFRCVYIFDYVYLHNFMNLFVYANLQDKSATSIIYANYIGAAEYEMGLKNIEEYIPNKDKYKYSTDEKKTDYLFLNEGPKIDEYVLLSVEVTKETIVELISHIFLYQDAISPNPSSLQLITTYDDFDIKLNFPIEYMEMINIVCVGGSGVLYWEDSKDKEYSLKGRDDRISITSPKSYSTEHHQLFIKGKSVESSIDPFVLLVEYNIRNDYSNVDSLNIDKSVNYIYTSSDFPMVLYCSLDNFKMGDEDYYDIFFTFYNLEPVEEKKLTYYESYPFTVHGFIVRESMIYESKMNYIITPTVNEETIFGFYDQGLRTGLIRIDKNSVASSKITEEKPYLYLKFDKSEKFKNVRTYKSVSFETAVFHKISETPASELSNQFGLIMRDQIETKYKLRNDKSEAYVNLEFSCEDDNLEIKLDNENIEFINEKYGKKFYTIKTEKLDEMFDLTVKRKNESQTENLQFFYFRYTFSNDTNNDKYTIKDTEIKVTKTYNQKNADYTISLYPIDYSGNSDIDITYMVRLIETGNIPNKSHVSMKIGIQNVKEYYKPEKEKNSEKLSFKITEALMHVKYIQVIVQIKDKEDVVFLSYDLCKNFTETNSPPDPNEKKKKDDDDDDDDNLALKIGIPIGAVLFIIIIVLVIVILIFNNKNKDLLEKVNKVSFTEQRGEDDLLLSKD